MAFKATDICKNMALREGTASATTDFNISRKQCYKRSYKYFVRRNKELPGQ